MTVWIFAIVRNRHFALEITRLQTICVCMNRVLFQLLWEPVHNMFKIRCQYATVIFNRNEIVNGKLQTDEQVYWHATNASLQHALLITVASISLRRDCLQPTPIQLRTDNATKYKSKYWNVHCWNDDVLFWHVFYPFVFLSPCFGAMFSLFVLVIDLFIF